MSIAACLLFYSVAVVAFGPPLLRRLTRAGHAPRVGVAAWLTAIGSVLIIWIAVAVIVVVDVVVHWDRRSVFVATCLARLRGVVTGDAGIAAQIPLAGVAASVAVAAALICVRLMRTGMRLRGRAHDHARAVRMVGHRSADRDVVVLEAAEPAAYCVSGRPPAIVVTSGAVAALDEDQLRAVLAHERAHLAGYHPSVVRALRSVARAFPRVPLMAQAPEHVSRLLEMCADDAAVRRHGRRALLSGLMALAGAAPTEGLGAADVAVLTRAERLMLPPALYVRACVSVALVGILAIIAGGPLVTAALASSGVLMCVI